MPAGSAPARAAPRSPPARSNRRKRAGASPPTRPGPGEGYDPRHNILFLTRTYRVSFVIAVAGLVLLISLYLAEYDVAYMRFSHYFDNDKKPAWFYLIFSGGFGGLAGVIQPVLVR